MALADVLRERVSRRGRTAQVDCGELGTVTVEALPPRECAALGMADGGRALLYAACRELQAAGETLRRERRLFTPDEVTQYVSDNEARTAARTVLTLSGVTLDEDDAESSDRTDEKKDENRLDLVQENVQLLPEIRPDTVREQAASPADLGTESANRLETVHENVQPVGRFRPTIVQFQEAVLPDGQVSREFFEADEADPPTPSMGANLNFAPLNLALSEKNDGFELPPELSGSDSEVSGQMAVMHEIESDFGEPPHETESEVPVSLHEITLEFEEQAASSLHEIMSEFPESVHEIKSEFAAYEQQALHETMSEFGGKPLEALHETESDFQSAPHEIKSEFDENRREGLHETTSELAEQVAERLLEGLRRAAAVR